MGIELFDQLLSIGCTASYDDVSDVPGAGIHHEVCKLADGEYREVVKFFKSLPYDKQVAFLKAVAAYENTVGGLGSVTLIHRLLQYIHGDNRPVLDWILKNTNSYWYYAASAKSVEDLERNNEQQELRRNETIEKELERERQAKKANAEQSGHRLANAIRRGDVNAVSSLLKTIGEYAEVNGSGGVWKTALRKQLDE